MVRFPFTCTIIWYTQRPRKREKELASIPSTKSLHRLPCLCFLLSTRPVFSLCSWPAIGVHRDTPMWNTRNSSAWSRYLYASNLFFLHVEFPSAGRWSISYSNYTKYTEKTANRWNYQKGLLSCRLSASGMFFFVVWTLFISSRSVNLFHFIYFFFFSVFCSSLLPDMFHNSHLWKSHAWIPSEKRETYTYTHTHRAQLQRHKKCVIVRQCMSMSRYSLGSDHRYLW